MPRLILDALWRAIGMLQEGATHADNANQFGVHRHIVRPDHVDTLPIRAMDTKLPKPLHEPSQDCIVLRGETVRNCPRAYGICPRRPCVRSLLLSRQRRARRRRCIFVFMHTLATESENTALSSHVLWRHQRIRRCSYMSSKFVVCSNFTIITLVSKYLCVMSWIGKMVANLGMYSFFIPSIYIMKT